MLFGSAGFRPNREREALSRRAKRFVRWEPGVRAKAKRRCWKRSRRQVKQELSDERDFSI